MDEVRVTTSRRPLAAAIAAVSVAAVVGGGLLGAARSPRTQSGAAAAPLAVSLGATKLKIAVDATRLPTGRQPQVTYVRGRTVMGGVGTPVVVPGKAEITQAARLWGTTLTVQATGPISRSLVIQDDTGKVVRQVKGVESLVTSDDGKYAAYAAGNLFSVSDAGGTLYFQEPGTTPTAVLDRPKDYNLHVLAVVDRTVYFASAPSIDGVWTLHRWTVDKKTVSDAKVATPAAVTRDGSLASGIQIFTDSGLCSALTDVAFNAQRWRTCEYRLDRFSPGSSFVVGYPPNTGAPYGVPRVAVLDTMTGELRREWTATSLRGAIAEDDDHLLLLWHDRPEPQSRSAVVRCKVSTGQCELATPLSSEPLLLGS